ncbi:MAG TPA: penicillin acylase family protein [Candidatus Limnocylindria bacterium]
MRRHPRLLIAAAVVIVLVGTIVTAWGFVFLRPLPTIDGDQRLLGLHDRAEVLRDRYGVPHIFAADDHDMVFLQGYVTAQDRLWQMDVYRRAAEGRLAEIFGDPALESDTELRTIGLARAAKADLAVASPHATLDLQAYADGVNKFLEQHGDALPVEFLILGYKPEPWSPVDSLAIAKLQLHDAAGNYEQEILRADIAERLGTAALQTLMPDPTTVLTSVDERAWAAVAADLSPDARTSDALDAFLPGAGEGLGSNCWVLSGSRTKSGKPLLAGDPHLPVREPSIWYEIAMQSGGVNLIGFSIPGAPGIAIGHNDHVAWSFTYAYADTQDLFVEHADPSDPRRFEYKGSFETATFVRESITVKGRTDPVVVDVAITRHGPIISGIVPGEKAQLALRWTALDQTKTIDAILGMDRAHSWDDFKAAAADFAGAALNVCYADTEGHIGLLLMGRLPDRPGDGKMPVPGWTGEYDWRGLLPASANFSALDPADGLIVNANQRPMASPSDAGWNGEWYVPFRYTYLRGQLEQLRGADVAAMSRLQNDYTSLPVDRFRSSLVAARPTTAAGRQALDVARAWNGALAADSTGAAIYEDWVWQLARLVFEDKLGSALYQEYEEQARPYDALYKLVSDTSSAWWSEIGEPTVSGRDAIAGAALDAAAKDLASRLGPDMTTWRWGDLHTVTFAHPLAAVKPLDLLLSIGPVKRAGDGSSPNNGSFPLTTPFAIDTHASERQIADLGDIDASVSVIPTGESGQPYSLHWSDQTPLWSAGQTKPMPLSRDRLGTLEGTLVLRAH